MLRYLLIVWAVILCAILAICCLCACHPKPEPAEIPQAPDGVVEPVATPEPVPTPLAIVTATASPTPEPPVRHASPKAVPTPATIEEVVKVIVAKMPGMQAVRWNQAEVKTSAKIATDKAVMLYLRTKERYEAVEKMRSDGVPAPVIFCLHMRESDNSFKAHLHEGSSLLARTKFVPKGRPLPPLNPPFKWEVSAEDAIYVADRLQGDWTDMQWSLDRIESYNGMGYRKKGVPSPYLWASTKVYTSGKFVSDGHYSATAIDQQLGVVSVLKQMQAHGIPIAFAP